MVMNRKVTGKAMSAAGGIAVGTGAALLVSLIGAVMMAWLIGGEYLQESAFGYGAMLTLLVASMSGSWITAGLVKHQRLVMCLITGGVYFLLLLGMTAFFFGGQYQGVIPTALLVAGGCTAAALLGNMGQGNRTQGRHKYRTG